MPFKPPVRPVRHSSLHRQAAIALYRALLTGTSSLPTTPLQSQSELANIIRNRFKQHQHEQSKPRLTLLFTAGYEALDVLDAARAGDATQQTHLTTLLSHASETSKSPPPTRLPASFRRAQERTARIEARHLAATSTPTSSTPEKKPSILDRPLPLEKLTGRRHVPTLFSALRIPVLRIKKPIPASLSNFIASRLKQRDQRWKVVLRLREIEQIAAGEDEWDRILAGQGSVKQEGEGEGKRGKGRAKEEGWYDGWRLMSRLTIDLIDAERQKNAQWARKLQAVEDGERKLFYRERRERRLERRMRRDKAISEATGPSALPEAQNAGEVPESPATTNEQEAPGTQEKQGRSTREARTVPVRGRIRGRRPDVARTKT